MGYWGTSATGESFAYGTNPDGSEMLWGDAPADAIDAGLDRLIIRLREELGRFPTVAEVDAVKATAPEMVKAIATASASFTDDIGRSPTDGEITAGLAFSDTGISVDEAQRRDIAVGDTVSWAVMRTVGFFAEVDRIAYAVVEGIAEREAVSSWSGQPYTKVVYVVRDGDTVVDVERGYASKVLPGDPTVDEVNARRSRN